MAGVTWDADERAEQALADVEEQVAAARRELGNAVDAWALERFAADGAALAGALELAAVHADAAAAADERVAAATATEELLDLLLADLASLGDAADHPRRASG